MSPDKLLPMSTAGREKQPLIGIVSSENLLRFLTGGKRNFPYKHWGFTPTLNLKGYDVFFKNLYNSTNEVYIHPPEIREKWRNNPLIHETL